MYLNYQLFVVFLLICSKPVCSMVNIPPMNKPIISFLVYANSPKTRVFNSFPWRQGKKIPNLSGSDCCSPW